MPEGPPETWGRGKRYYLTRDQRKPRKPGKANCPFCDNRTMEADTDEGDARIVWRCPLGCGLEYPLCRTCFPHTHHQPQDCELIRWDAIHLSQGCLAPESTAADGVQLTGQGHFATLSAHKDLRRYVALLAAEVWTQGERQPGYDLYCRVRAAARGQLVQATDWRRALIKMPLDAEDSPRRYWVQPGGHEPRIEDDPGLSCALSAAAVHIVTQAKIHPSGQRRVELPRGHRYVLVAEGAATAAGVSSVRRAELQVQVQIGRWSSGERLPRDVQDAAVAAVLAGKERFARKLVEMHANDRRKARSAGG
jgi:hypothetical protein